MLGFAESENVRLISREIIFTEFQPIGYDHDTSTSQTDRRDRRTPQLALAIPRSARLHNSRVERGAEAESLRVLV